VKAADDHVEALGLELTGEILNQNEKLLAVNEKLRELSIRDELTGLYNHRYLQERLTEEFTRAVRYGYPISCLILDLDHFRRVNDTLSHTGGDEVLKEAAGLLLENCRLSDLIARFGGEEFVILLPDTDKNGAMAVAEKLRHLVQEKNPGVTISVGVAHYPEDVAEVDDLIDHADIALYDAKDAGRNKVFTYKGSKPLPAVDDDGNPKPPNKPRMVH